MKTIAAALLLTCTACAYDSATVKDQEDREYRRLEKRIEAAEEFERRKQSCGPYGGFRDRRTSSERLPPTTGELRTAMCER